MTCPSCRGQQIVHRWRTDMATLHWIDDFKCLSCGERWIERTHAIEYEELPRDHPLRPRPSAGQSVDL